MFGQRYGAVGSPFSPIRFIDAIELPDIDRGLCYFSPSKTTVTVCFQLSQAARSTN